METAGLVVGVAGIAGVFSACIDLLSRAQKFKTFKDDAKILAVRLAGARVRFEQWGVKVGIRIHPDDVPDEQSQVLHPALRDRQILNVVKEYFKIIEELFPSEASALDHDATSAAHLASPSRRRRLAWAMGGKEIRTEHVAAFETLVQNLHDLVPPDSPGDTDGTVHGDLPGLEEVRGMLSEMAQKATCKYDEAGSRYYRR